MRVILTNIMGVELEKQLHIDMHKNLGKISKQANPTAFEKVDSVLLKGGRISFNSLHCYGYVGANLDEKVKISLCKGTILKVNSLHLNYECLIVGEHVEDYQELKATECTLSMHYSNMNVGFYEKILTDVGRVYEINKKSEAIMSYKNNVLKIKIRTLQEPATFNKIIELITYMYEVVFLTEGNFPKRIGMTVKFDGSDEERDIFYSFSKCYQGHTSQHTEIGAQVFKRETILKEWILFRKKTDSLFDYYLYAINMRQFIDIDLFHVITVLEGYSKYTEVINKRLNPRGKRGYIKLYDRLLQLNNETPECKIIFASQIEEGTDYILKLVDHRNDFSHQFQYKQPFNDEEMREFFHKLNLLLRVLFFREVGVDVQDRQVRAIVRKYFTTRRYAPTYARVFSSDGEVIVLNQYLEDEHEDTNDEHSYDHDDDQNDNNKNIK